MSESPARILKENIILRMHPIERISLSLACSAILYAFIFNKHLNVRMVLMSLWDVFSLTFIILSWVVIFTRPQQLIRRQARKQDGSLVFVFGTIIFASIGSLVTVLSLIISKDVSVKSHVMFIPVAIGGMILSWVLVHTVFTFHYAHIYYDNGKDPNQDDRGLNFPDEKQPDYLDFAYFSFVLGMTFQVSDVTISSRKLRRLALFHGLISFGLNTFVVALAINFIAGLRQG